MPQINNYSDLKKFGFNVLTGEACNYSMRMLVDLSEEGFETLCQLLGVTDMELSKSWNNGDFSAGSFMMPRSMFEDLAIFILITQPETAIVCQYKYGYTAYTQKQWEEHKSYINEDPDILRRITPMHRQTGDRVQHAMSGRTV